MVRIELTEKEAERLRELCEAQLSDLRMEIAATDSVEFRAGLKQDAGLLRSLIEQLSRAAQTA
ncbi:MAG TPA: hypothetical protein VFM88_13475 [Vicinamibacteria bacterium]|nr:hypothetical protein [Vicinamibacteria bacterium]